MWGFCRSDYNSKLFNGLELVMLVDILVFRFFLRSSALETVGWLGFFFLQVWSHLPWACHADVHAVSKLSQVQAISWQLYVKLPGLG